MSVDPIRRRRWCAGAMAPDLGRFLITVLGRQLLWRLLGHRRLHTWRGALVMAPKLGRLLISVLGRLLLWRLLGRRRLHT